MSHELTKLVGQTRREFMATTGAVAGAAMLGAAGGAQAASHAAMKSPKRGGVLRFATRADARGLDPHRNYYYYVSHPLAATSMGFLTRSIARIGVGADSIEGASSR